MENSNTLPQPAFECRKRKSHCFGAGENAQPETRTIEWTCCAYSNFPSSFPLRDKLSVVRRWKAEKVRALPAVCRAPSPFSLSFSHSTSTSHRKWAGPGTTGSTRSLELCEVSMTRAKKSRLSERDQKSIFDAIVRARNARERFNSDEPFFMSFTLSRLYCSTELALDVMFNKCRCRITKREAAKWELVELVRVTKQRRHTYIISTFDT